MRNRLHSSSDAELAALCQQGNPEAFNRLAQRWDAALFRFVRRMLGNDEDARDTCQEALLKAYLSIGRLRDPAKFVAWLHHIALNLCRDRHRAGKVRTEQSYEEGESDEARVVEAAAQAERPDRLAEQSSLAQTLNRILDRLPLEQRTAILLREYQGFSSEEIAQITGVPATTVRTRIFYGLRSMKKMLPQHGISETILHHGGE